MVTQKRDPDSQDTQAKDERQQTQTKDLTIRYRVKTLPAEDGDPAAIFTILPGSLYKHYLKFTSCQHKPEFT